MRPTARRTSPTRPRAAAAALAAQLAALEARIAALEGRLAPVPRTPAPPEGPARPERQARPPGGRPGTRCAGCSLELPRAFRGAYCVWCGFDLGAVRPVRRRAPRKGR